MIFSNKEEGITYFKKLNYNIKEGFNWFVIIPFPEEIEQYGKINRYHTSYIKTCKICNNNFNHGLKNTLVCGCCKLFIKCNNCNIWFEKERNSLFINEVQNQKEIIAFCSQKCAKSRNGKLTCRANAIKFNERTKSDPKLSKMMYEARSYVGRNFGKKNIYKALDSLQNEHKEILIENGYKVQQWLNDHPNERIRINTELAQKYGAQNLKIARERKINQIIQDLNKLPLNISYNGININNILELCKNDICGAYIIKGKFKNDRNDNIYNLLVCKSNKIYNEIYWVLRVISHPEKQDKYNEYWTIAKWWYISNLYYDFTFVLLTNPNGVSEKEALLAEAKCGFENNMLCDKNQIIKDNYSKNHSYWSL